MFTTVIINDCRDANAMGRQMARVGALFGGTVVPVGVENDLEAAGCLVDMLDAIGRRKGLILANVAPRNGVVKKYPNGSPFCYFSYQRILVAASLDGLMLSLVKKLKIVAAVKVLESTPKGQFRSFDFLPYAARDIFQSFISGSDLGSNLAIDAITDPLKTIWYIDCFGNAKTTLLPEDIDFSVDCTATTNIAQLRCYQRLANVPDNGQPALIIGSSGVKDKRFLEIVVQGGSAAELLGLKVGQIIL